MIPWPQSPYEDLPMLCKPSLGFAAAADKQPGDCVSRAGRPAIIREVRREGKDWPYFLLDGWGWVSWQTCGDCVPSGRFTSERGKR